ncbi:MAG TPA: response regulator [Candidatus Angelobacter sp.]|jgi:CheY-like chemotaxis protein|nr:response regulator [Candidatus Angelobacter sp.]
MSQKILFVDDEPEALDIFKQLLESDFRVDTAVGAAAGLELINANGPYAVVVSDMRMPDMDGLEFLKRVHQISPNTVSMILTGHREFCKPGAEADEAKVFRFLSKPCKRTDLVAAINTALAHGNKSESTWVYSGEDTAGKNKGLIELPLADMGKLFGQLKELDALEATTLAGELRTLALFRDLMSGAARHGKPVPISYRRTGYKTPQEAEDWTYLPEGYPLNESKNSLLALFAAENDRSQEVQQDAAGDEWGCRQSRTDCLYLLADKKWLIVERSGVYSDQTGSSSWFDSQYRLVSDRAVIGRFAIQDISVRLLESMEELARSVTTRMGGLKQRSAAAAEFGNRLKVLIGSMDKPMQV